MKIILDKNIQENNFIITKKAESFESSEKAKLKKETIVYHVVEIINGVMKVLDKYDIKELFLAMGNCKI